MESKGTMDPSVQAVLQNLRVWSSESTENFEKMHQRSLEWLHTSVSNTATMFSLQLSNKPLPPPRPPSIVPIPPKMSLSLAVNNSKMKPEKRPQLKLSSMEFTQIDDEELPTLKSKPEVPTRKRMSLGSPRKCSIGRLSEPRDAKKLHILGKPEVLPVQESRKSDQAAPTQDISKSDASMRDREMSGLFSLPLQADATPAPTLSATEYDEMTESMSMIIEASPMSLESDSTPVDKIAVSRKSSIGTVSVPRIAPPPRKSSAAAVLPCIPRPRKSSTGFPPARQLLRSSPEPGFSDDGDNSLEPDIVVVSAPCPPPPEPIPAKTPKLLSSESAAYHQVPSEPLTRLAAAVHSPPRYLAQPPQIKSHNKLALPMELESRVEDSAEPGLLVSPDPPLLIAQQPRFSFTSPFANSAPGAGSPFASQLNKFSSPDFSPISRVTESPIETRDMQDSIEAKPEAKRVALTRTAKALEEKAREEKEKALRAKEVDRKAKDELAKQRRVEAERKRKLLEEEELKKKQQKAEERAKKMETFEKKKNLQHQEQKKLKEDKRTIVKEKAEALKKTTTVTVLKEEKEEHKKPTTLKPLALKRPLQPVAPTPTNDGLMSPPPNRPPRNLLHKSPENVFQLVKKQVIVSPRQNHDEDNYEMSDYRDDDDESSDATAPKKPIPAWARGAMLSKALEAQNLDPDEIFHPMEAQACDLNAIFENFKKKKRFQHRSSSGNWLHDRLHWKEEQQYRQKMGFQPHA